MQRFLQKAMSILLTIAMMLAVIPGFPQPAKADPTDSWADFAVTEFAGGTGGSTDPYLIATEAQLAYLAKQVNAGTKYRDQFFKLANNLDLSAHFWTPIGTETGSAYFDGTFDGNGKTISNVQIGTISAPHNTVGSAGLFGYTGNVATIKNLGVTDIAYYVGDIACSLGGLLGMTSGSTGSASTVIDNCYTTGSINGGSDGQMNAGGLVGNNCGGVIRNSFSSVNVTLSTTSSRAGGLVGRNSSIGVASPSIIENCYATGNVIGGFSAGGLVAMNNTNAATTSTIRNSYAVGNVTGTTNAGGLVAYNSGTGGGTVTIENTYWNQDAAQTKGGTAQTPKVGVGSGTAGGTALSSADMTAAASIANALVDTLNANKGSTNPTWFSWTQANGVNGGYPTLVVPMIAVTLESGSMGTAGDGTVTGLTAGEKYKVTVGGATKYVKADGTLSASASDAAALTGTAITGLTNGVTYKVEVYTISEGQPAGTGADADNPYLITTAGNLLWMSQNCTTQSGFSGKYFKQTANIDLTGLGEFVPIGSMSHPFKGHYDGNNHKILELYIHGSYSETGLLGDLKEGTIKNLTLEDVSISGNNWAVAGFVGYLESTGTVANCHITKSNGGSSSIEGTYPGGGSAIGGIAGENDGTIEYCSNAADISNHRSYAVGGIAGGSYTSGSEGIYNCYNSGAITGTTGTGALGTVTGGIAGDLSGNISHCYNIGTVTVGQLNSIGGIVGKIGSGSILGNYFLATAADSGVGIDTPGTNSIGATAKTSTQLKTKSTFDGWNFTTGPLCWVIDGSSNSGYPFISSPAVVLASGSLGTAGDSIITGLTSGTVYKVTVGSTVYYVKADGTLSTSASDAAALTGTEITGLSNDTTYLVEVYSAASVTLAAGSLGTAGNGKITGLASGEKYQVIAGSTVYYVKADGTLSASLADMGELAGTEVTGLVNGTTYKVELYSTVPSAPANLTATAGNGRVSLSWGSVSGAVGYSVYQSITSGSYGSALDSVSGTVYAVTGLTNGTPYYFKVKAYNAAGYSTFSNEATAIPVRGGGNSDESSSNTASPPTPSAVPGANILVNGKSENAGMVVTSQQDGQTITTVVVDQQKLEQKLASEGNNAVVTIPVNSQSDKIIGELNGQMVKNMETKAAVLELKTQDVTYTLPAQQINIEAISKQLGQNVGLKDIKVQIEISRPSAQEVQVVESTAQKGEFSIVIPPVQFSVKCTYNNKTIEIASFNHYVERTIAIPDGVDPNKITTGVVFDPDGTVRHVPTQVVKIEGKYYAKINSLTNSTYSVIWNPIEFNDVADHWARTAINDMGSRMVVSGVGSKTYEPDRGITRAEFATVMVKALGLKPGIGSNPFQDVKASEWYTDFIKNAYEYKIISGYSAVAFGPADKISREQAMTMIYKAMKITNLKVELEAGELEKLLVKYSDSVQTAEWARESMAACVKAGIVSGKSANIIGPRDEISRAEVAVMVRQLLQISVLI